MKRLILSSFVFSTIFLLTSCGGGGGDDTSAVPSNNACSEIGLSTRIINGTECSIASSPVVRVVALNGFGDIIGFCSGTAVTQNDIVTAAHCFPRGTSAVAAVAGDTLFDGESVTIPFANVIIHPDYAPLGAQSVLAAFNDVAIVRLSRNLKC